MLCVNKLYLSYLSRGPKTKKRINELSRKKVVAGGKKNCVTNAEITPVNDTVGVRAVGVEGLILMRITKPLSHPTVNPLLC